MRCRLLCLPALSEFTDELGLSLCSRCLPSTNRFKPKFCEPIQLSQSEERRELQKEHLVLHNARRRFQPFACSHPFQQSLSSPLLSSPLLSSLLHPTLVLQLLATHAYIKAKTRAPPRLQKRHREPPLATKRRRRAVLIQYAGVHLSQGQRKMHYHMMNWDCCLLTGITSLLGNPHPTGHDSPSGLGSPPECFSIMF